MFAPGWPGIPPRWTSSAKSGLGTAVSRDSRVWFTLSHGILNEIYYPRVDHACTRDLGFHRDRWSDVLLRRKAGCPLRDVAGGARRSGVSDSQHGRRRPLSHREGGADRPVARRRAATRAFRAAPGHAGGFPALRAAGAAPRQPRQRQHGVGRRLQGHADAVRRARQLRARAGVHGAVARPIGRVRRHVSDGWQQLQAAQTTASETYCARRERQRRGHRRSRSRVVGRRVRDGARVRSRPRWKPVSTRSSACSKISTARKAEYVTRVEGMARERSKAASCRGSRTLAVSHQRRRAAHARIQTRGRRRHRQPVDPVGLLQARRRPGRLSPGVAARSRRDRRRLHRRWARTSSAGACCDICR